MRSLRRVAGAFDDVEEDRESVGRTNGLGGRSGADWAVARSGLLFVVVSLSHDRKLAALEGCVIGVRWPVLSVKLKLDFMLVAVHGVDTAGDSALRKSV